MESKIRTRFTPTLVLLGLVAVGSALITDLAAPLGNLAAWAALAAAICFIGLMSLYVMAKAWLTSKLAPNTLLKLLFFTGGAALIFTIWSIVVAAGPPNGYLSNWVTPIADLQSRWFSSSNLEVTAEDADETTTAVITNTIQSKSNDELLAEFAALQVESAPLADPQTPLAWYYNARHYAQAGNVDAAQAAYSQYFADGLAFVDPYLDYANLLRTTTNLNTASAELLKVTSTQADERAATLAAATLIADPQERLAKLQEFASSEAEYGPAWYELTKAYVQALQANFTQRQFQRLQAAFEQLQILAADEDAYQRYYLDQTQAEQQLTELAKSVAKLETIAKSLQLTFLPAFGASEATIAVVLPELSIQELHYNIDDPTPITSTGVVTLAGQVRVNTTIGPLPLEPGEHTLYINYVDRAGEVSPVYSYDYTIQPIGVSLLPQRFNEELSGFPVQVTLAVLDSEPQALYTYRYSVNSPTLEQSQRGLGSGTVIQLAPLPPGDHTLYLQAESDGVSTPIVEHSFRLK